MLGIVDYGSNVVILRMRLRYLHFALKKMPVFCAVQFAYRGVHNMYIPN